MMLLDGCDHETARIAFRAYRIGGKCYAEWGDGIRKQTSVDIVTERVSMHCDRWQCHGKLVRAFAGLLD